MHSVAARVQCPGFHRSCKWMIHQAVLHTTCLTVLGSGQLNHLTTNQHCQAGSKQHSTSLSRYAFHQHVWPFLRPNMLA